VIVSGTHPPVHIDLGSNKPDMTLQRRDVKKGRIVWCDVMQDGEVVKSPVDIDALPFSKYRLKH